MDGNPFLAPPEPAEPARRQQLLAALALAEDTPNPRPLTVFAKNYAADGMRTLCLDLVHDGQTTAQLFGYVERFRGELIDTLMVTLPERALMALKVLRGPQQLFEEWHLQTLAGIPQEQRRKFITLLQETTADAPSIALYSAAMHDYEAQPDPWNDWRDVGKALAEFHYLRGMKALIREAFDRA